MRNKIWLSIGFSAAVLSCKADSVLDSSQGVSIARVEQSRGDLPGHEATVVPISDMGSATYKGFAGGLYPAALDIIPTAHASVGIARAKLITPLDANGRPSASGKYVLLSIGISNASDDFCAPGRTTECDPTTFLPVAAANAAVNHSTLVIINGAQGGEDASDWANPSDSAYDIVRDTRLSEFRVTEKQVQAIWLKVANSFPSVALPAPDADAYRLETLLGDIVRSLKVRYPNLKEIFISSRSYGGYGDSGLNPEPFAFESALAVKWVVQAQIDQARVGRVIDPRAGNLDYNSVAPWIAWGPYLWANGTTPRSDGLQWLRSDYDTDGTHPSASGTMKVATALLNFFRTSAQAECWFLRSGDCG